MMAKHSYTFLSDEWSLLEFKKHQNNLLKVTFFFFTELTTQGPKPFNGPCTLNSGFTYNLGCSYLTCKKILVNINYCLLYYKVTNPNHLIIFKNCNEEDSDRD